MRNNFTLLYAEDDQTVRESYSLYFNNFFEEVYSSKDGKEAWEVYKEKLPNVVILDINMPKLSGLDVAKKIREIDETCKIIMLTAYSDLDKMLNAMKLKLTEYIIKPAKRLELENIIKNTVSDLNSESNNHIRLKHGFIWDVNEKKII